MVNYSYNPLWEEFIADRRIEPFTGSDEAVQRTETLTIPTSSPYYVRLREVPRKDTPSTVQVINITDGNIQMAEVTGSPGSGQFRVNYDLGFVEFNSADAGKEVQITYYATGSLVWSTDVSDLIELVYSRIYARHANKFHTDVTIDTATTTANVLIGRNITISSTLSVAGQSDVNQPYGVLFVIAKDTIHITSTGQINATGAGGRGGTGGNTLNVSSDGYGAQNGTSGQPRVKMQYWDGAQNWFAGGGGAGTDGAGGGGGGGSAVKNGGNGGLAPLGGPRGYRYLTWLYGRPTQMLWYPLGFLTVSPWMLIGAGGGGGGAASYTAGYHAVGGNGGNGGGAVILIADKIIVDGSILANGQPGGNGTTNNSANGYGGGGGGGAGGTILLYGAEIILNGTLQANGGNGGAGNSKGSLVGGGSGGTAFVIKVASNGVVSYESAGSGGTDGGTIAGAGGGGGGAGGLIVKVYL